MVNKIEACFGSGNKDKNKGSQSTGASWNAHYTHSTRPVVSDVPEKDDLTQHLQRSVNKYSKS